jgi:5-methylcytosine-specific restriction endonuclease McrA
MTTTTSLTDDELIARVRTHCAANARLLADLIIDLIDVEDRGIHLREACSSMFEFCKRRFAMSPSQAWRRTTAARLVRRVPVLLQYVRRGEIDLSTLLLLRNVIDETNAEELIRATRCRSKRQIERYLESRQSPSAGDNKGARQAKGATSALTERLDAISEELHLLEIAIRNETRILIERARHLVNTAAPNATLADLVHQAFEHLVETLENAVAEARLKRARHRPPVKTGYISRAVRYAVFLRDGFQCTFVSADSERRCTATRHLEIDHIIPRARGGTDELDNLRCVCRAHNRYFAEQILGKQFMLSRIRTRQTSSSVGARVDGARA